jgi:filamentous hemagglutinin
VPVDAKVSVVTRSKTVNQAARQAEALRQNGSIGIWKVPTLAEGLRAKAMIARANASDRIFVVVEKP